MPMKIFWPQDGLNKKPVVTSNAPQARGRFVASGRASDNVCGLTWSCELISNTSVTGGSNGLTFFRHASGPQGRIRWSITIRVPQEGDYRLTVVGQKRGGGMEA